MNGKQKFGRAPFMPKLREISLTHTVLQPLALSMLRTGNASSLESLTISSVKVSSHDELDWGPLATTELPALRHLSVADSWRLGDTLFWLLGSPSLGALESLDLARAPELIGVYSPCDPTFDPADVLDRRQLLKTFEIEKLLTKTGMDPEVVAKALASI